MSLMPENNLAIGSVNSVKFLKISTCRWQIVHQFLWNHKFLQQSQISRIFFRKSTQKTIRKCMHNNIVQWNSLVLNTNFCEKHKFRTFLSVHFHKNHWNSKMCATTLNRMPWTRSTSLLSNLTTMCTLFAFPFWGQVFWTKITNFRIIHRTNHRTNHHTDHHIEHVHEKVATHLKKFSTWETYKYLNQHWGNNSQKENVWCIENVSCENVCVRVSDNWTCFWCQKIIWELSMDAASLMKFWKFHRNFNLQTRYEVINRAQVFLKYSCDENHKFSTKTVRNVWNTTLNKEDGLVLDTLRVVFLKIDNNV